MASAPRGDARGGLAGAGALEDVTRIGKVVLQRAGEIGVAGTRRGDGLVLRRIALFDGKDLGPVLPVVVGDGHRDGRADGLAVPDSGEDVRRVALDAHAAAAAVAALTAPELAADVLLIDRHAGWKTADQGDETLAVALTCCGKSKHRAALTLVVRT